MAPTTRAQKQQKEMEAREELQRQLDDMAAQRDAALAQVEKLQQENQSLRQQLSAQANANPTAVDGTVAKQVAQGASSTTVPTTISALPKELLAIIFSYLSQQDVCQVVRVCRLWNSQQPNVISKVRSISLMICSYVPRNDTYKLNNQHMSQLVTDEGSAIFPKYKYDQQCFKLQYRSLRRQTVRELGEKFPATVTLRITINGCSFKVLDNVMQLIRKWSTKLTTLELWCAFNELASNEQSNKVLELFKVVNSLPMLKHLTVELQKSLYKNTGGAVRIVDHMNPFFRSMDMEPRYEMPILARLHEFNFGVPESICDTPLYHLLRQHIPTNNQLARIRLSTCDTIIRYEEFAELFPAVAARIAFLPSVCFEESLLLPNLPSLTELNICIEKILKSNRKFGRIVNLLSPLSQLVHLKLDFGTSPCNPGHDNPTLSRISQLNSVKMLTLTKYLHQNSVEWTHWAWALPNVQIIELSPNDALRHNPDKNYCKTLFDCPKLRRVFFLEYDDSVYVTHEAWTEWVVVETPRDMMMMTVRKVSKL